MGEGKKNGSSRLLDFEEFRKGTNVLVASEEETQRKLAKGQFPEAEEERIELSGHATSTTAKTSEEE